MDLVLSTREFLPIFLGLFALSFTVVAQESCEVDGGSQPSVGQAMLQKQSARMAHAFDMDQPKGRIVDINIGCNFNPMPAKEGNFLLLVDPLPDVCSSLSQKFKTNTDVAVLCCAISNYTGSATFLRYNTNGQSSSLSSTMEGKTFKFPLDSKDTVIVLEGAEVLGDLIRKQNQIERLKTDMQGYDLTTLKNLRPLLQTEGQIIHIKSECFFDTDAGRQQYQGVDNSCHEMLDYLRSLGYTAKLGQDSFQEHKIWGDVYAYKTPALDFLDLQMWG